MRYIVETRDFDRGAELVPGSRFETENEEQAVRVLRDNTASLENFRRNVPEFPNFMVLFHVEE